VFCFLKKGEDPRRGYPKLVTAAGGVRHRGVDPSIRPASQPTSSAALFKNFSSKSGPLNNVRPRYPSTYKAIHPNLPVT